MVYRFGTVDHRAVLVHGEGVHDLQAASDGTFSAEPMAALGRSDELHALAGTLDARSAEHRLADVVFGPPVPRPRNCLAIGLNYRDHADEFDMEPPEVPLVFTKFPGCIVAGDADVVLESETADWEVELVVAIGAGGKDIAAVDAWDRIAGVTIGQDISDRALQFAATPPHFDLAKSRDTYGPLGPVLVSPDAFDDPDDIALACSVNGEEKQSARTSQMIFDVPTLVAYLSGILTLHPGDLIWTGTPSGIGAATGTFLRPGDEIVSAIDGIGTITNRCV